MTDVELEQWETLCNVAMTTGLCPQPAVDPTAEIKICEVHLGLAVGLAKRRGLLT